MATLTRQSLRFKCTVEGCPWPQDEEIHVPWCLGIPDVEHWRDKPTHQHWPKKGMGGNNPESEIVAILCPPCHDRIDNGDWGNRLLGDIGYIAWDLHGKTLIERMVMPDASSQRDGNIGQREVGRDAGPVSDGAEAGNRPVEIPPVSVHPRSSEEPDQTGGSSAPSPSALTHDQRVAPSWHPWKGIDDADIEAEAQRLRKSEVHRQFEVGDFAIWLEQRVGNEAASLILETCPFKSAGESCPTFEHRHDILGYQPESFGNIVYVCSRIPEELRHPKLRFSHHVVAAQENREDIAEWLDECEENQWSVAEFRRQKKPPKTKTKRWPMEELLAGVEAWNPTDRPRPKGAVRAYLKWLGEQG